MQDIIFIIFLFIAIGAFLVINRLLKTGTDTGLLMTSWGALNLSLLFGYLAAFITGSLLFILLVAALFFSLAVRRRVLKQQEQILIPTRELEALTS